MGALESKGCVKSCPCCKKAGQEITLAPDNLLFSGAYPFPSDDGSARHMSMQAGPSAPSWPERATSLPADFGSSPCLLTALANQSLKKGSGKHEESQAFQPRLEEEGEKNWRDCLSRTKEIRWWSRDDEGGNQRGWIRGFVDSYDEYTALVSFTTEYGQTHVKKNTSIDIQPAMRDRGMTIKQLLRFASDCKQQCLHKRVLDPREYLDSEQNKPNPNYRQPLDFEAAPTKLVVDLFVRPHHHKVPFVDGMCARWPDLGGPSRTTHFVSHAWDQNFMELVRALETIRDDSARFWICCFAMTQDQERLELVDDSEIFAEALTADSTQQHVLVCDQDVTALDRLFVLFELFRAKEANKTLHIAPPDMVRKTRLMRGAIELTRARCTDPKDEKYIRETIEHIGLQKVNESVRNAVLLALRQHLKQSQLDTAQASVDVARALRSEGQYEAAEAEHRRALATRLELLGEMHKDVAESRSYLGFVLKQRGELKEAEKQCRLAVDIKVEVLAEGHPDVAASRVDLGCVLSDLGRFQDAEAEQRAALAIRKAHYGDCHLEVGHSHAALSAVLLKQGRLGDAEVECRTALQIRIDRLSDEHRDVATSRHSLGEILFQGERWEEAEKEFSRALDIRQKQLGENHPNTEKTRVSLQRVLDDKKYQDKKNHSFDAMPSTMHNPVSHQYDASHVNIEKGNRKRL